MNNDTPADAMTQVEGGTDDILDVLIEVQRALKMQEGAEIWNSNCVECEGSGDWAVCSICADAFGNAIDARNSVMPLIDTTLARHRTTSLAAQDGLVKHMADRFLGWKLPENFHPDNGISFKPTFNDHMDPPMRHNPIGTNLFNATQAEEMVRYMLEGYDQ